MTKILYAKQVKAGRAALGWSQKDLAELALVAVSTIADWERGRREPIPNNQLAVLNVFNIHGVIFHPHRMEVNSWE